MFPRVAARQLFLIVFTFVFIIICYRSLPQTYHRPRPGSPKSIHIDSPWTHRIESFPVESFEQLPTGSPIAFPHVQATIQETAQAKALRKTRLESVKSSLKHSWNGYRNHAWLEDELRPISGGSKKTFGDWAATLVDSLDTLWIMELYEEFDEAVQAVTEIDFERSASKTVIVFETTIRYLGGLLSAYELSGREILLEKALGLGWMLYAAFDTPSRMPVPYLDWKNALDGGDQDTSNHAISADIGSLSMEFTKLSQLTGDMRFFDAIQRISNTFASQQKSTGIPGLWPVFIDAQNKNFASGDEFSFGALADSLYEYTFKMHILLGGLLPSYSQMYIDAIDAAKKHLFVRFMNPDNRKLMASTIVRGNASDYSSDNSYQHLACFTGGMVGMGSKLFQREEDLGVANMLTDGCYFGYEAMRSGIMPETMIIVPCLPSDEQCNWNETKWKQAVLERAGPLEKNTADDVIASKRLSKGIAWIADGRYILRPEAIESVFYMYRLTGDVKWQEKAWKMYESIDQATQTVYGYAAIENVAAEKLKQVDSMESFWTAETLKYFYLIFSDLDLISLDEWVFNTEAHPFRRTLPRKIWWSR